MQIRFSRVKDECVVLKMYRFFNVTHNNPENLEHFIHFRNDGQLPGRGIDSWKH